MFKWLKNKSFGTVSFWALLLIAPASFAGPGPSQDLIESTRTSFLSGDLGTTFVSEYIPRGVVAENQGVIAQPYMDLNFRAFEGTGWINSVIVQLTLFASIHSHVQPQGSTDTTRNWFEFDANPSIAVGFAKKWVVALKFIDAESPANAFRTALNLNTTLSYDDSELLGRWALHPHLTILRELRAQISLGPRGWYYEPGIAPSFVVGSKSHCPLTVVLPVTAGFGSNGFYAGNTFGYVSGGSPQASHWPSSPPVTAPGLSAPAISITGSVPTWQT